MTAGTIRPVVVYKITTRGEPDRHMIVPLVNDTGPGRLAQLAVVRACYPRADTITPVFDGDRVDSVPARYIPHPNPRVARQGSGT